MNLVKEGTSAVVGLASGALETQAPVALGGQSLALSLLAEGAVFLGGTVMQFMSPYTMPSVVDGAVDGAIALLGRRAGAYVMKKSTGAAMVGGTRAYNMPMLAPVAPRAMMNGMARPQVGSISNLRRYSLT